VRFLWFWTFWHWSAEAHRAGALLRGPLHDLAGHWDEWYRHEASPAEQRAIAAAGRSEPAQRAFAAWLLRDWARDAGFGGRRAVPRFVLGQLAALAPFDRWRALADVRGSYGAAGISAVVLDEGSRGEAADVRRVEAIALPADDATGGARIAADGFRAAESELDTVARAVASLLRGRGLARLAARWAMAGARPYAPWLGAALGAAWIAVAAMLVRLRFGPDPGDALAAWLAALVGAWVALCACATVVAATTVAHAWRAGRRWGALLARSEVRLRMDGGLTLRGESAGLPFCLDTLLALHRAHPQPARDAWLWRRLLRGLRADAPRWAATGVVTASGAVTPVVLEPKVRAALAFADGGGRTVITSLARLREGVEGSVGTRVAA